jgi:thioredoxin 1
MSTQKVIHLSDDTFLQTIKDAHQPVFVDFYADWCGPCQMAAPIIEKLAEEYAGKILITKLNIDQNRDTPTKYGVMSIPTVIIFVYEENEIKVVAKQIGFTGEPGFKNLIEQALKK